MRAMRKGDLAFFYHSSCAVPGAVGVMRIVAEHSTDESAFDPEHPYFDPKSDAAKPKWEVVHVEFVKKFDNIVTLRDLKSEAPLSNMQMLRQSRLSISSVTPNEWAHILGLAGEPLSLGQPETTGGYESDIDGEGEETTAISDADGVAGQSDDDIGPDTPDKMDEEDIPKDNKTAEKTVLSATLDV
jgi:predicted RNA-binding protein with PUA-like domain